MTRAAEAPRARRRTAHRGRTPLAMLVALLPLIGSAATATRDAAHAFLASSFDLTSGDLARLDAGQVIARTLDVRDKREIATLGVVRIRVTPELYVERLTNIATFKRDEAVLQIGTFNTLPDLRDVAGLTLDEADIRSLRGCRVESCGVQLSAGGIDRVRQHVDWNRADAPQQANLLMRQILVEHVAAYRRSGAASVEYADHPERTNLRREFVSLAGADGIGWKSFPALRQHLFDYPAATDSRTIDIVYWSKEKTGRKAVVSVTHLAISRERPDSIADYAIASKHVYGTHYFDASLGLTVLVRDPSAGSPATYLVYLNRSRVDVFGGMFGAMARKIVSAKARGTVADQLARLQRTLEAT